MRDEVRTAIERVSLGDLDIGTALHGLTELVSVPPGYVCSGCGGQYPSNGIPLAQCGSCGGHLIPAVPDQGEERASYRVEVKIVPPNEILTSIEQRLGYLRPRDTFRFTSRVPDPKVNTITEYVIVPSQRGYVSFTWDYRKVITLRMEHALLFEVQLLSGRITPVAQKFYPGDKVRNVINGASGVILSRSGDGYQVRKEDGGDTVWFSGSVLRIVDRDGTTRGYIQERRGKWVVSFGDHETLNDSLLRAVMDLRQHNRAAFNRYSRMLAFESVDIPAEVLEFLRREDPKIWRNPSIMSKRNGSS